MASTGPRCVVCSVSSNTVIEYEAPLNAKRLRMQSVPEVESRKSKVEVQYRVAATCVSVEAWVKRGIAT